MYVVKADTCVDGEIIHSLLALFNQGVFVNLPTEVFYFSVDLFQGLINRHRTHRYRTVAHNPFTRFVDVVARRQVHQRIASPLAAPYGLVHLFVNAGSGS